MGREAIDLGGPGIRVERMERPPWWNREERGWSRRAGRMVRAGLAGWALLLGAGCSVRQMAVNQLGNALAGSGGAFAEDEDAELIRDAAPFSLKLIESLLAESPEHPGLLLAAARGFTQYAYAFVQQDADRVRMADLERSRQMQARAGKLFLRARDYGLRGLEVSRRGFGEDLEADPALAARRARAEDVPLLYWTAAAWLSAIALDKTDAFLVSDLPKVRALLERALELDEAYDRGALPTLMITFEGARQGMAGDRYERARGWFARAVELSGGGLAAPYVSLAEAVCIPTEERGEFLRLLEMALAVDPDAVPEARLANRVAQERARWLQARVDDFFLPPLEEGV